MDPLKTGNPGTAVDPAANKGQQPNNPQTGAAKPDDKGGDSKANDPNKGMVPYSALHEAREENRSIKEELGKLKEVVGNIRNNFGGDTNPNPDAFSRDSGGFNDASNPTVHANAQRLNELWDENPRLAMQTEMSMMLNWYDKTQAELDVQEEEAAKKFSDFNQYRPQIRRYLRMVKPEMRGKAGTVETAYYLAKGQDSDKLKQAAIDEIIGRIQRGEQIQGINVGTSPTSQTYQPGENKPTAEEMKVAEAMGIPVEEYLKNRRK